jgi:Protein of unknown function (DUF2934)
MKHKGSEKRLKAVPKAPEAAGPPIPASDRETIARLAYCLWQARGCPEGSPEEDWFKAEREVRSLDQHPSISPAA